MDYTLPNRLASPLAKGQDNYGWNRGIPLKEISGAPHALRGGVGWQGMSHLAKDMEKSSEDWERWCSWEGCEKQTMPGDWGRLPAFRSVPPPSPLTFKCSQQPSWQNK